MDFDAWYEVERPSLLRAVWTMTGDRELAADVVDEAFSRALERWSRVGRMDSPGGWVRTVALNGMKRALRRRSIEARLLRRRPPDDTYEDAMPDPTLWSAVRSLPVRQREVIALRYLLDCSESETAAALGISEGAASATLTRARRRLAEVMHDDEEVVRS